MPTFVLLTRLSPEVLASPSTLESLERETVRRVALECPEVEWVTNYAVFGPYDYLDVFTAPDLETAAKVATIVRVFGHAHTETWAAIDWQRYKQLVHELPDGQIVAVAGAS